MPNPTEGRSRVGNNIIVDRNWSRSELSSDFLCCPRIGSPCCCAQAKFGVVGDSYRLSFVFDRQDGGGRSERLLLHDPHLRCYVRKDGGSIKRPFALES